MLSGGAVAIVARKSTRDERQVSVSRQRQMGEEWAKANRVGDPVEVFSDNAVSGMKMDRPGWEAFTNAVRSGRVSTVWTYEQSRLTRAGSATWEEVCVMLAKAGIREIHTHAQGVVSIAEGQRLTGRLLAVFDLEERERARIRTLDTLDLNARAGRPTGASGYGYRRVEVDGVATLEPHPTEAPIVARMVDEVAAGRSLAAIAAQLNAEGVRTLRGATWIPQTVRAIVSSERIIARRVHRGVVVGPANWPPLVDRATWEKARDRLANHRPGVTAGSRRKYLLTSGLAECGECGATLISGTSPAGNRLRLPSYLCPHPSRGGCGKCSILADRLEGYISDRVEAWLTDPDTVARVDAALAPPETDPAVALELARVESDLADLAERWGSGEILAVEHAAARRVLAERHTALSASLAAQAPSGPPVTAGELLEVWRAGDVLDRRRVLAAVLVGPVKVGRAIRGGHRVPLAERITTGG